jgi:HK97 family phage prohead protease
MQHIALKASTVAVDQEVGQFTALVSAWDADREDDTIAPTAFDRTMEAWQRTGKNLPLLFEHSTEVIGHIDASTMRSTKEGLVVSGEVDRSTDNGMQVWRTIKAGAAGFSIGYLSEDRPREGGGREITEVDLLEISATSKPMHPATRALSWKSAHREDDLAAREAELINRAWGEATRVHDAEGQRKRFEALTGGKSSKTPRPVRVASFEVE